MRDEAFIELRLEHAIGERAFMCHIEVRFRFIVRNVDVLGIVPGPPDAVPYRSRSCWQSVPGSGPCRCTHPTIDWNEWSMVVLHRECDRRERYDLCPWSRSLLDRVRAGITVEQIVEAAILLDDVDDVVILPAPVPRECRSGAPFCIYGNADEEQPVTVVQASAATVRTAAPRCFIKDTMPRPAAVLRLAVTPCPVARSKVSDEGRTSANTSRRSLRTCAATW